MSPESKFAITVLSVFLIYTAIYLFCRVFRENKTKFHRTLIMIDLCIGSFVVLYLLPKVLTFINWPIKTITLITFTMLVSLILHSFALLLNSHKRFINLLHFQITHLGFYIPLLITAFFTTSFFMNSAINPIDIRIANLYGFFTMSIAVGGIFVGLKILKLPYK